MWGGNNFFERIAMSIIKTLSVAFLTLSALATQAQANNARIERALKSQPEFASFYEALAATVVNQELNDTTSYTVFAPTNEAFAAVSKEKYPCFYSVQCKEQIADIVRNHVVKNEQHVEDIVKQKGVLFSLNGRQIPIGLPNPNRYTADGRNIVRTYGIRGSVLYALDGIIANEQELAIFTAPTSSTLTQKVLSYSPVGTVDAKTTIIETTTTTTGPVIHKTTPESKY
jgi:uncharacterized surface protein with fasciclin (FAS1) repeats